MSIAGLEAVESKSPDFARWAAQIEGMRLPDGSFGEGPAKAFATGGAAAAILRMGLPLEKREAVIAAIKAGQRPDGAWSKDDGASDLSSSYRVMRCLYMLKEKPDAEKLREYIAELPPARRQLFRRARRQGEPRRDVLRRDHPPLAPPARRRDSGPRADRLHPALRRQGPGRAGRGTRRSGRPATACSWASLPASITTSSWPPGRATATSSSRSGSSSRTARATAASSSAACAFPAPRCRATRPTSARTTGAACTTSRGATRSWSRPRPRPSSRSRRTAGTTTSSAPWETGSRLYLNGVPSVVYREEDPGIARDGQIAVQIHAGAPMEVQFKDLQIRTAAVIVGMPRRPGVRDSMIRTCELTVPLGHPLGRRRDRPSRRRSWLLEARSRRSQSNRRPAEELLRRRWWAPLPTSRTWPGSSRPRRSDPRGRRSRNSRSPPAWRH